MFCILRPMACTRQHFLTKVGLHCCLVEVACKKKCVWCKDDAEEVGAFFNIYKDPQESRLPICRAAEICRRRQPLTPRAAMAPNDGSLTARAVAYKASLHQARASLTPPPPPPAARVRRMHTHQLATFIWQLGFGNEMRALNFDVALEERRKQ